MPAFGNRGFEAGGFNATIFEEFQDILGDLFGFDEVFGGGAARRRGRGARGQRGADLRYDMSLSFEEAAAGVTTKIRMSRATRIAKPATAPARSPAAAWPRAAPAAAAGRWPISRDFSRSRARARLARARGR